MKIREAKAGYKFRHVTGGENLEKDNAHWTVVAHGVDPYGKYDGSTLCILSTDNGMWIEIEYLDGDLECCGVLSDYSERTANDLNSYGKKTEPKKTEPKNEPTEEEAEKLRNAVEAIVGLAFLSALIDGLDD